MHITAEIRYFWHEAPPKNLEAWFLNKQIHNNVAAGGGKSRVDTYLFDKNQDSLGIKARADRSGVEIKGLVCRGFGDLEIEPFAASIDLWTKWISEPLDLQKYRTIAVEKTRWIRKFDTYSVEPVELNLNELEQGVDHEGQVNDRPGPTEGCIVELTKVTIDGDRWWTLGFEAFGTLKRVSSSLKSVATLLASRQAPQMKSSSIASYPAWLCETYKEK